MDFYNITLTAKEKIKIEEGFKLFIHFWGKGHYEN
jgi:hypothetical protein